jgi:hypothetical protein
MLILGFLLCYSYFNYLHGVFLCMYQTTREFKLQIVTAKCPPMLCRKTNGCLCARVERSEQLCEEELRLCSGTPGQGQLLCTLSGEREIRYMQEGTHSIHSISGNGSHFFAHMLFCEFYVLVCGSHFLSRMLCILTICFGLHCLSVCPKMNFPH